ncbi:MAG: pyrroline-5-carboxylate reductase [Cucumibacter sp.]
MNLAEASPITLIGAGRMGGALARGWIAGGLPASGLTLVEPAPSPEIKQFAKTAGIALLSKAPVKPARVLVMAVKPQIIGEAMAKAKTSVGASTMVLSIAAGVTVAALSAGLGTERVVRTMPNTPAQIGKGVAGVFAAPGATVKDRSIARALLKAAGEAVWVERESDLDIVTAVSGSGPAYVFHLVEAMAAAGVAEGLDESTAMMLARQTVIGAAALLAADVASAAELRQNVTSPGGTTAAALKVLMGERGLTPLMKRAIAAARRRSAELGR